MSRSAVRVRSSALFFVAICRENFGIQRGFGTKAGANLAQPAEEALLVEWRRDGRVHRFDGKASCLGVGRQNLVCVPPECASGTEHGAEYQPAAGVAGGTQREHPAGQGTSTEYFAVVVAGLLDLLLSLLSKRAPSRIGTDWAPVLRRAWAVFRPVRAPTSPILQVFRL